MRKINILKWDRYNRLTIIKEVEQKYKRRYFQCRCDCWLVKSIQLGNLRNLNVRSCWCLQKENSRKVTHWVTKTKFYNIYKWIKQRCNDKNHKSYKHYWYRGIKNLWKTFEDFRNDMYESYLEHKSNNKNTSIDRINNNWNYKKSNCNWATMKEQNNNRSSNLIYKWKTVTQWAEELGINRRAIYYKLSRGYSIKKSLEILKK